MTKPERPISVLLAGPTGVGKTLLASTLPESINRQLERDADAYGFIKINCNELKEEHQVTRLTGAPPSYAGYGDKTLLSAVADRPHQIILFDEIEKASPAVLDVLMTVLDRGELQLNKPVNGNSMLDLRHCILFFTTNLSVEGGAKAPMGFRAATPAAPKQAFATGLAQQNNMRNALVDNGMRREIAGRFTQIVCFNKVDGEAAAQVLALSVQRFAGQYGLKIRNIEPAIMQELYDASLEQAKYGARTNNHMLASILGMSCAMAAAEGLTLCDLDGSVNEPVLKPVEETPAADSGDGAAQGFPAMAEEEKKEEDGLETW